MNRKVSTQLDKLRFSVSDRRTFVEHHGKSHYDQVVFADFVTRTDKRNAGITFATDQRSHTSRRIERNTARQTNRTRLGGYLWLHAFDRRHRL